MAITYTIRKTKFQSKEIKTGKIILKGTYNTKDLIKRMLESENSITEPTIIAVLKTLAINVKNICLEGSKINIEGFVQFTPYMSGTFDSDADGYDPVKQNIYVGAQLSKTFNTDFSRLVTTEKQIKGEIKPILLSVRDVSSKEENTTITGNGIVTILGDYLKFKEGVRGEYLRFIDKSDNKNYVDVMHFQKISDKEIIFQMPETPIKEGYFEIATWRDTGTIKVGRTSFMVNLITIPK